MDKEKDEVLDKLAFLAAQKYARSIHREEYDNPAFTPDICNTIKDFKAGFIYAINLMSENQNEK